MLEKDFILKSILPIVLLSFINRIDENITSVNNFKYYNISKALFKVIDIIISLINYDNSNKSIDDLDDKMKDKLILLEASFSLSSFSNSSLAL